MEICNESMEEINREKTRIMKRERGTRLKVVVLSRGKGGGTIKWKKKQYKIVVGMVCNGRKMEQPNKH